MKTAPFRYARPERLDEALALLAEFGDDAKILAGGLSLLPVMALRLGRPEVIVDIGSKMKLFSFEDEGCELLDTVEKLSILRYPPE